MGGFGSGGSGGKRCTDDMLYLDVRRIHREGLLAPGRLSSWQWTRNGQPAATISFRAEEDHVVLHYRNRSPHHEGGEWEPMNYPVLLDWTSCGFGGWRVWWRCPALGCGRRVALLYGGRVFACRRCNQLAYRSQRERSDDRAARKADKIRRRLGWQPGILNGKGHKPKGMHWHTFDRLEMAHDTYCDVALLGMAERMSLIDTRLADIASDLSRSGKR
jgi:hypothetical protein